MIKKYNDEIDETIIYKKLPSGLNCYIIPKEMYNEKRAMLSVKYGSIDRVFRAESKLFESPLGTAHFLEHKMFDNKGGSAFDSFSARGAYVNAFTSFNNTAYYFSCDKDFKDNLETLLGFVSEPYFTEETVEKERGIIEQEISMYDDNPGWAVYFGMLDCLYENHPAKENIAGTKKTVGRIDKDILYKCYESFYVPENMQLICSGNVDIKEIESIAEKYFKRGGTRAKTILEKEPEGVRRQKKLGEMKVSRPIFQIGFKEREHSNQIKKSCLTKIMLELFIGQSSELREELVKADLADDSLSFDYVFGEGYGYTVISGESNKPEKLLYMLQSKAVELARQGFEEADFNRIKKKLTGSFIRGFNSIEAITHSMAEIALKGGDLFDCYAAYRDAKPEDINELLRDSFKEEYCGVSIVKPVGSL